ncbi:MAG: hypothetical protein ACRYHQ_40160 [Janthinobacterium lividum]
MRRLLSYALYCLAVLGLFTYGHFYGRSLFDDMPDQPGTGSGGGGGGSGSGYYYTGTSGGSHK